MTPICPLYLHVQCSIFLRLNSVGLFYESHHSLEDIWYERRFEKNDEVRLLRALINAAVSFELVKRGRRKSALKPWGFYQRNVTLVKRVDMIKQPIYNETIEEINKLGAQLHA